MNKDIIEIQRGLLDNTLFWNKIYKFLILFLNNRYCHIAIILMLGIVVYYPILFHDFQDLWDDQWVVLNYYTEEGLKLENLKAIVAEFYHGQYAPLNQLYYSLLFELFGYNAFVFHAAGLFIHLANSIVIYKLVLRLIIVSKISGISQVQRNFIALLTSSIFIIHPLTVESVAWLAASKILIYSLFYLLCLLVYTYYLEKRIIGLYLVMVFLFILSFAGKEQAVTLPICLLLIDYLANRDFKHYYIYVEKIPFFILAFLFGFITMRSQAVVGQGVLSDGQQYPILQRVVFAAYAFSEYLTKAILPIKLSYIYPFPNQIGEPLPLRLWLYPIAIISSILSFSKYFRNKWILFCVVFFALHIAITLHIIPIARFTITADRYAYISIIPICFCISCIFNYSFTIRKRYTIPIFLLLITYLVSFSIYTHQRSKVWRNSETLKKEIREIILKRDDFEILKTKYKKK